MTDIKADPSVELSEILIGGGASTIVYVDRRLFKGKLRYVILDDSSEILGVADEREIAFAAARQYGLEPVSAH